MKTALIINPVSQPKGTRLSRLNPFGKERFDKKLAQEIEELTDSEVTLYEEVETLEEVPDQVVIYGGDGSIMRVYNHLLTMTDQTPPILIVGGGSGTYWSHNLGIQTMRRKDRIALLENGCTKSFPLIRVEYDGTLSPHDVTYVDSFGMGDFASWIHSAETIKEDLKGSQKNTAVERAAYILLSYIFAGANYFTNLEHEYEIKAGEEYATIHGSTLPVVGLGIKIYNPEDGFSVHSTTTGPNAHLTSLVELAEHLVGKGNEEIKRELTISTQGKVPIHFNGTPFIYEGESIKLTYEPDKVKFICK